MQTANILYAGFYDAPLASTVRYGEGLYVSVRDFNDDADEYEDEYRAYRLPPLTDEQRQSWLKLEEQATDHFGKVPIRDVVFDETKRREIETGVLERLLADAPRELTGVAR